LLTQQRFAGKDKNSLSMQFFGAKLISKPFDHAEFFVFFFEPQAKATGIEWELLVIETIQQLTQRGDVIKAAADIDEHISQFRLQVGAKRIEKLLEDSQFLE
jgi:hypothetical protein